MRKGHRGRLGITNNMRIALKQSCFFFLFGYLTPPSIFRDYITYSVLFHTLDAGNIVSR